MAKEPPTPPINWNHDEDIVVPKQMPIRVFVNSYGNIALVQESENPDESDQLIEVRPENVRAVIEALERHLPE